MKKLILLSFFILNSILQAQVGIGTVTPEAQLDIRSSNQITPANNDGILIPKIDEFPVTFPTLSQDGMMVFATGNGSVSKGFYYWDNSIPDWVPLAAGSGSGHDWYEVSTTTAPNSINDSIYTLGNVAIGKNTAAYRLDIFENAADNAAYINLAGASNNPVSGLTTEITNTGDGDQRGVNTILNSSGIGNHYGVLNTLSGSGIGFKQGVRNELSGTSDGSQTGTRNLITNSGNGTHWAVLNTLSGIGTGNHIGTQNTFSDTGSGFHTGFYSTFSQGTGILTGNWTEFTGNVGSSASNQIAAYNSYFAGGDGILAGSYTDIRSSVTGNGTQYGSFLTNSSSGSGTHYGIRNELAGTGTGDQEGVSTLISNTNGANHFGLNTRLSGTGNGNHKGAQFSMSGTGSGFQTAVQATFTEGTGILTGNWTEFGGNVGSSNSNQIAAYNSYFAGGNGILAGSYTDIRDVVLGTGSQYGSFLSNSSPGSGTHYGSRHILAGSGTGEQYGVDNTISNTGNATHVGVRNTLSGTGTGYQTGVLSSFSNGSGNLTGYWTDFNGPLGNGNQIAAYNSFFTGGNGILAGAFTDIRTSVNGTGSHFGTFTANDSPGSGAHYGNFNQMTGTGTGAKYGTYNSIPAATGGIHYGVYSDAQNASSYAGYFLGNFGVDIPDNTFYVNATNNRVGIGTITPATSLHINHPQGTANGFSLTNIFDTDRWHFYVRTNNDLDLNFNGNYRGAFDPVSGTYTPVSDRNLKTNISQIEPVLEKVKTLEVVDYNFIDQPTSKKYLGFIAQDVEKIFPNLSKSHLMILVKNLPIC